MRKERRKDLAILLLFFVLATLFFWRQTIGGQTMLPADNLFAFQPWSQYASQERITVPHNDLLSDLVLENYVWKQFIIESLQAGQIPLWNPYILSGVPFLAAGQHSAMYPLSVLFYVLPLASAYGWFALLHTFLAGAFMYLFARTLKVGRLGSTIAGTTFMFCGAFFIQQVFPMIVAALTWLPFILMIIERIVARAEESRLTLINFIPELLLGALGFGMVFLAGHPEMYYYIGLTTAIYALYRLIRLGIVRRQIKPIITTGAGLGLMALLGVGLGSAQWVPLLELVRQNFREGSTSFQDVLSWAWPWRRVISMFVPDFYGNPTHHAYFDLYQWKTVPVTSNWFGDPVNNTNWGMKNYVEGAGYLGFLPSVLAIIALLRRKGKHLWFFAIFSLFSILFVFGSPLYIIIYKLPGLSQVHSPFRWIYPFSVFMSIVAGMGAESFWNRETAERVRGWLARLLDGLALKVVPWLVLGGGLLGLAIMAGTLIFKERMVPLADRAVIELAKAQYGIESGRMFYSYEFHNLLIFGITMVIAGLVLLLRPKINRLVLWGALAVVVGVGEVYTLQGSFFPAVDPELVGYKTPVVDFLKSDPDLFRITAYTPEGGGTFIANAGMYYGLYDARGYDSIIPKQYAEFMRLIDSQNSLLYNRISPLMNLSGLKAPLLDALNVKYVLTDNDVSITAENYTLVYDDEVRVYRNDDALPRAYLVPTWVYEPNEAKRQVALHYIDPRQVVSLEEEANLPQASSVPTDFSNQVESIVYTPNEVTITVNTPIPCFLVLADAYFDGWLAFIRPADAAEPDLAEQKLHIYRADGNFRAVEVPAGRSVVRFKYSPNSVKYGLYASFMSVILLLLIAGFWGWRRFFRFTQSDEAAQRVTKNTLAPITLTLVNKLIDMAFAMLMLRILGPADAGEYYLAIVIIGWFDILTNFGLNTLLTREVAKDKDPATANRYLSNSIILRLGLCVGSVPVLGLFFLLRQATTPLAPTTMLAIALFGVALIPSNISASYSALFNAYERMEIPASITTVTTVLKVLLGTVALLAGTGYVGLAGVSILVNLVTTAILAILVRRLLFHPHASFDIHFQKWMLAVSYPLMINHLLATLFFKVAVLLLEWRIADSRVVGWYSTAYKYIDAVGIIPPAFTMAIFPLISRYAVESKDTLLRAYRLALKLLLAIAIPGALLGWGFAYELITILGGSQYLPYAADILRVMIWYMPFGFINSVTQYVLIALDQQRFLTRAFAIGLTFNVAANLLLLPRIGYMASAFVTVASEVVLFAPFYAGIRQHLARINWLGLAWRLGLSAVPLALLLLFLPHHYILLAGLLGILLYLGGVWGLRVFDAQEREIIERVIPLQRLKAGIRHALPLSIG